MPERRQDARLLAAVLLALCAGAAAERNLAASDLPDDTSTEEPGPSAPADPLDPGSLDLASLDDARVSLTLRSDISPYELVRYEIKRRGSTLIASLSKRLAGGYDELGGVALLPADDLPRLITALLACDLGPLPEHDDSAELTYELDVDLGQGFEEHVRFTGLETTPGTPEWCAVRLIINTYEALGDPVLFENRFWNDGEYGQLQLDSSPAARVLIDGRDIGLTTPLRSYRLEPGLHTLRFVNDILGIDRTYDVTIELGLTTRLDVELR